MRPIEDEKLRRILSEMNSVDQKIRKVDEKLGYFGKDESIDTEFGNRMSQLGKFMRNIRNEDAAELHKFIRSREGNEFMQWLKATVADKVLYENLMKLELQFKGTGAEDLKLLRGTISDFKSNTGNRLERSAESMRSKSLSAKDAESMRKEMELDYVKRAELERIRQSLAELSRQNNRIIFDAYNKSNEFLKEKQRIIESMKKQRQLLYNGEKSIEAFRSLMNTPTLSSEALKAARESLINNADIFIRERENELKHLTVADQLLNSIKNAILGFKRA